MLKINHVGLQQVVKEIRVSPPYFIQQVFYILFLPRTTRFLSFDFVFLQNRYPYQTIFKWPMTLQSRLNDIVLKE